MREAVPGFIFHRHYGCRGWGVEFNFSGFRGRRITLVTTLSDPQLYPAEQLATLYVRRWRPELCLRDLKTTLGMNQLRSKSPDMAEKELLAYLVAHNLIRYVMSQAVAQYSVDLNRTSFKGTTDALR